MIAPDSRIYVAGHRGLVGSAIVRCLQSAGFTTLLLRSRHELDLRRGEDVRAFFAAEKPEYVFLPAGKVGGIAANARFPADFIYDNLAIELNVIDAARGAGVRKLAFFGSSCIYPKFAPQPIREDSLLAGPLEPTNEPYAVAKIAGIKLCQAYRAQHGFEAICLMPTNLYGPGDNFDLETSHVLPALIRKIHEAKMRESRLVTLWGSGKPRREFMHVDDLASASLFLMQHYEEPEIINIGIGEDIAIADLALLIARVINYRGAFVFDQTKPDGTPRKLLDVSKLHALGWRHSIGLEEGIASTYESFLRRFHAAGQ